MGRVSKWFWQGCSQTATTEWKKQTKQINGECAGGFSWRWQWINEGWKAAGSGLGTGWKVNKGTLTLSHSQQAWFVVVILDQWIITTALYNLQSTLFLGGRNIPSSAERECTCDILSTNQSTRLTVQCQLWPCSTRKHQVPWKYSLFRSF